MSSVVSEVLNRWWGRVPKPESENILFVCIAGFLKRREQGCGVRVETRVGVGRSGPFWLELESELESVKFGLLRPGVAD